MTNSKSYQNLAKKISGPLNFTCAILLFLTEHITLIKLKLFKICLEQILFELKIRQFCSESFNGIWMILTKVVFWHKNCQTKQFIVWCKMALLAVIAERAKNVFSLRTKTLTINLIADY